MSFKSAECWLLPTKSKSNIGTIMKCIKEMPYNDDTTLNKLTINKNWKVAETNGNKYWQPQHLYITINERPKVGDWYIVLLNGNIPALEQVKTINDNVWVNKELFETTRHIDNCFKIIACTDTSLTTEFRSIDLVQAIDAEFLEWFVKNPSFERVEVNIEGYPCMSDGSEITFAQPVNLGGSEDIRNNIVSYNKQEHTDTKNFVKAYDKKRYKIIIPKEEESNYNGKQEIKWISENQNCKQIDSCYNSLSKKCICPKEEPKQGIDIELFEKKANEIIANIGKKEAEEKTFNFQEKLVEYFNNTPREKILEDWDKSVEYDKIGPTMEEFLESKQDYKKLSKKFTETLTSIPDDVLIKYTQQETLEEAGLKHCELIDNFPALENSLFSFKEGAKWQQERSHSEAIEFAEWIRIKDLQTTSKDNWIGLDMKYYTTEELFEQFKKK